MSWKSLIPVPWGRDRNLGREHAYNVHVCTRFIRIIFRSIVPDQKGMMQHKLPSNKRLCSFVRNDKINMY